MQNSISTYSILSRKNPTHNGWLRFKFLKNVCHYATLRKIITIYKFMYTKYEYSLLTAVQYVQDIRNSNSMVEEYGFDCRIEISLSIRPCSTHRLFSLGIFPLKFIWDFWRFFYLFVLKTFLPLHKTLAKRKIFRLTRKSKKSNLIRKVATSFYI